MSLNTGSPTTALGNLLIYTEYGLIIYCDFLLPARAARVTYLFTESYRFFGESADDLTGAAAAAAAGLCYRILTLRYRFTLKCYHFIFVSSPFLLLRTVAAGTLVTTRPTFGGNLVNRNRCDEKPISILYMVLYRDNC